MHSPGDGGKKSQYHRGKSHAKSSSPKSLSTSKNASHTKSKKLANILGKVITAISRELGHLQSDGSLIDYQGPILVSFPSITEYYKTLHSSSGDADDSTTSLTGVNNEQTADLNGHHETLNQKEEQSNFTTAEQKQQQQQQQQLEEDNNEEMKAIDGEKEKIQTSSVQSQSSQAAMDDDNDDEIISLQKSEREKEDEILAQEENVRKEIAKMQEDGLWSPSASLLKRASEPKRNITHWDYLLREVIWLARDFHNERKWKMEMGLRTARAAVKYHISQQAKEKKRQKEELEKLKRQASKIARIVRREYWMKIQKIVELRQKSRVDEAKQKFSAKKRDYLVKQTENYTRFLSQKFNEATQGLPGSTSLPESEIQNDRQNQDENSIEPTEPTEQLNHFVQDTDKMQVDEAQDNNINESTEKLENHLVDEEDDREDFEADESEEDDETTLIEEEENDDDYDDEIEALKRDAEAPVSEILSSYEAASRVAEEEGKQIEDGESQEKDKVSQVSAVAKSFQPTGFTLNTTSVKTKIPPLLNSKFTMREYQHIGLDWLVTMYERNLNGILADEMGLGKTIQTIALLAYIAYEKHIWGQHLVIVPSSVMLNWEMEFKRWCPSFKILTYYGSAKERKLKRKGWNDINSFDVCITSYNLVVKDKNVFKRKKWHYMILDEAHYIKNFKGQCWQTLLTFNTDHRLLLTGTPLQNSIMELWSLMHFLMPELFQSHSEFKDWFNNPVVGFVEGTQDLNQELIGRLHTILRPFILRRLKRDVEKQLPLKYEHIVPCKLSKRQRNLYEDFMSRSDTQQTLISGNVFRIINILMQLRKVCDHPDLFEPRPIISSFNCEQLEFTVPSLIHEALGGYHVDLDFLGLRFIENEVLASYHSKMVRLDEEPKKKLIEEISDTSAMIYPQYTGKVKRRRLEAKIHSTEHVNYVNRMRRNLHIMYGYDRIRSLVMPIKYNMFHKQDLTNSEVVQHFVKSPQDRVCEMQFEIENLICSIPKARAKMMNLLSYHQTPSNALAMERQAHLITKTLTPYVDILWKPFLRTQLHFPDKRLLQFDCGKLQKLATMLRHLREEGHRVLIFTQMSKMLDILEAFLSMYSYSYFRLDGSTKVERRQYMMEKFNSDSKIFAFILSTRSGGLGINLTGADTVIFYDSDWNPAMDAQAQDRCHRIGQTRDVHIYRLISESTIEERILKKASQKRHINELVIQKGGFTPEFFKRSNVSEIFGVQKESSETPTEDEENLTEKDVERMLASAEDSADVEALKLAKKEQSDVSYELDHLDKIGDEQEKQGDEESDMLPIHKYGIKYVESRNMEQMRQELEQIEEEERNKEEEYKFELDSQQVKQVEEFREEEPLFYEVIAEYPESIYENFEVVFLDDTYIDAITEPPRKPMDKSRKNNQKRRLKKSVEQAISSAADAAASSHPSSQQGTSQSVEAIKLQKSKKKQKERIRTAEEGTSLEQASQHQHDELTSPDSKLGDMKSMKKKSEKRKRPRKVVRPEVEEDTKPVLSGSSTEILTPAVTTPISTPVPATPAEKMEKKKRKSKKKSIIQEKEPEMVIPTGDQGSASEHPWTTLEDSVLTELTLLHGTSNWDFIADLFNSTIIPTIPRISNDCKRRSNYLNSLKGVSVPPQAQTPSSIPASETAHSMQNIQTPQQADIRSPPPPPSPDYSREKLKKYCMSIALKNINRIKNCWAKKHAKKKVREYGRKPLKPKNFFESISRKEQYLSPEQHVPTFNKFVEEAKAKREELQQNYASFMKNFEIEKLPPRFHKPDSTQQIVPSLNANTNPMLSAPQQASNPTPSSVTSMVLNPSNPLSQSRSLENINSKITSATSSSAQQSMQPVLSSDDSITNRSKKVQRQVRGKKRTGPATVNAQDNQSSTSPTTSTPRPPQPQTQPLQTTSTDKRLNPSNIANIPQSPSSSPFNTFPMFNTLFANRIMANPLTPNTNLMANTMGSSINNSNISNFQLNNNAPGPIPNPMQNMSNSNNNNNNNNNNNSNSSSSSSSNMITPQMASLMVSNTNPQTNFTLGQMPQNLHAQNLLNQGRSPYFITQQQKLELTKLLNRKDLGDNEKTESIRKILSAAHPQMMTGLDLSQLPSGMPQIRSPTMMPMTQRTRMVPPHMTNTIPPTSSVHPNHTSTAMPTTANTSSTSSSSNTQASATTTTNVPTSQMLQKNTSTNNKNAGNKPNE